MAIKIIGRDGQERKQGDTSSWGSPSKNSSPSPSPSPNRSQEIPQAYSPAYQQQNQRLQSQMQAVDQERPTPQVQQIKQVQGSQSSPRYSPTYQQQNARLQEQIKAVEAGRPKENPFPEQSLKDRTINAIKQGYAVGQGKPYNLDGLKAPENPIQRMSTYSLSQKANTLSEQIDRSQNKLLSGLPKGAAKDFITGVTNIPEMAVSTVGNIPLGAESILRNPRSISDSLALGTGALAGATVLKAKTHPGELAGELIGAVVVGKAAGKIETKTVNIQALKSFTADEKATLAPKLIYKTKEPKTVTAPDIETHKPTAINKISFADDVQLTPEMEEVLFGKHSTIKQPTTELETRNIFSPEMTKPSEYHIRSMEQKNEISRATISKDVKLTPEMEEVLFRKTTGNQKFTELEARDIFSPEMTKPSEYHISSIRGIEQNKSRNPSIQIPTYQIPSIKPGVPKTTQIGISSAIIDSVPIVGQRITLYQQPITKTTQDNIIQNTQSQKSSTSPSIQTDNILNPQTDNILNPQIDNIPTPQIDNIPNPIPNPKPIPNPNPIPNTDYIPDTNPFNVITFEDKIKIISLGGGGFDPSGGSSLDKPSHKKTKKKMITNAYGDPFNIKNIF